MRKLGAFIWFGYQIPIRERARLIHEAGFETALHWWDDTLNETEGLSREKQAHIIREEGLVIENAHLRPDRANDLWLDTLNGQAALDAYLADIDSLAKCEIPVAVMHVSSGPHPPPVSSIGMKRFEKLVEKAESSGVRIAAENVRNTHMLENVLDLIDSAALGFCYDSGHDSIWSKVPYKLLAKYGNRLFAVHLHDNMGLKDDHLPLGEGIINWEMVRTGIEKSSYQGSLTLESDSAEIPASRRPQAHLKRHYDGAKAMLFKA